MGKAQSMEQLGAFKELVQVRAKGAKAVRAVRGYFREIGRANTIVLNECEPEKSRLNFHGGWW